MKTKIPKLTISHIRDDDMLCSICFGYIVLNEKAWYLPVRSAQKFVLQDLRRDLQNQGIERSEEDINNTSVLICNQCRTNESKK